MRCCSTNFPSMDRAKSSGTPLTGEREERLAERLDCREPIDRFLLQRAMNGVGQAGRNLGSPIAEGNRVFLQNLLKHGAGIGRMPEGRLARESMVERGRGAILIRGRRGAAIVSYLLGRNIVGLDPLIAGQG